MISPGDLPPFSGCVPMRWALGSMPPVPWGPPPPDSLCNRAGAGVANAYCHVASNIAPVAGKHLELDQPHDDEVRGIQPDALRFGHRKRRIDRLRFGEAAPRLHRLVGELLAMRGVQEVSQIHVLAGIRLAWSPHLARPPPPPPPQAEACDIRTNGSHRFAGHIDSCDREAHVSLMGFAATC